MVKQLLVAGIISIVNINLIFAQETISNRQEGKTSADSSQVSQKPGTSDKNNQEETKTKEDNIKTQSLDPIKDIILLIKANVSENLILSYIRYKKFILDLSAENIVELTKEGVTENIIKELIIIKENFDKDTLTLQKKLDYSKMAANKTPIVASIPFEAYYYPPNYFYNYHKFYQYQPYRCGKSYSFSRGDRRCGRRY